MSSCFSSGTQCCCQCYRDTFRSHHQLHVRLGILLPRNALRRSERADTTSCRVAASCVRSGRTGRRGPSHTGEGADTARTRDRRRLPLRRLATPPPRGDPDTLIQHIPTPSVTAMGQVKVENIPDRRIIASPQSDFCIPMSSIHTLSV